MADRIVSITLTVRMDPDVDKLPDQLWSLLVRHLDAPADLERRAERRRILIDRIVKYALGNILELGENTGSAPGA
ncbi:hypothetical protein LTR28_009693 [Elasticomyces elasticus]|nr:hypothetical protein LTR28_009693 [Elasticomyces elasticus]